MRIAIVTRYFHPDITPRAFRAYELAKEFSRRNHEVIVFTSENKSAHSELEAKHGFSIDGRIINHDYPERALSKPKKIFRFILNHFFLFPQILLTPNVKTILSDRGEFDLLISIAHPFPIHFGVSLARKRNPALCKTWIADCGDPFSGNKEARLGAPFYYKMLERYFLNNADYITVPINEAIHAFEKTLQKKIKVIPQGFEINKISKANINTKSTTIKFAYAGVLSFGIRDPRLLLDYLLTTNADFIFTIYTENKEFLNPYVEKMRGRLIVSSYIPREKLLEILSEMDFLVNLENRHSTQSPSKLIDYAIIGRPVLNIGHEKLDKENVESFLNRNYERAMTLPDISQYEIKNIATKFIELSALEAA